MKKVGLMIIGLNGAIGTTLSAGLIGINKGIVEPIGLVTELKEFKKVNLVELENLYISGWDINEENHLTCVKNQNVVPNEIINQIDEELTNVKVYNAPRVGISNHILHHNSSELNLTRRNAIDKIINDINDNIERNNLDSCVIINAASTEMTPKGIENISDLNSLEKAIESDDPSITSGMLFAYASIITKSPYVNFTPSLTIGLPSLQELALREKVAICGNDGKTGQTLYKTVIAPMLKWRNLKLDGWYSANILGNNDGRVLEDPEHKKAKISSKSKVLDSILDYDDYFHRVEIHYYPPRGDSKEAWDNIDFTGWLGKKMSMKINWLGEDSILAAPLLIDLARLIEFTNEKKHYGVASHLSSFFKDPEGCTDHDFHNQISNLLEFYNEKTASDLG